ncbi:MULTISPECIES: hypothetical protein [unclassified Prochlorococcus]|uniref:hypothetical protein n=1 Tax=unclassified Prochlorococcus TaxID=2627481 RepID=UPI0005339A4C|nr:MULTISPECIES: hypothetical protein [unclassified Prochlorococcus]KGG15075.1 hypothetical protein EV06_0939 [Prochlorococcus sp. MIT 0602]KGG17347.1 hypothetical protein EV07_0785 [Prochlorococcus sp. MIT 0603]
MSFDSHSLERLQELGRSLPRQLPTPKETSQLNPRANQKKLHPIETEEDPQKLFGELIKASPDGKIPSHLIDRLKKAESLDLEKQVHTKNRNNTNSSITVNSNNKGKKNIESTFENDELYTSFKQLLLEEED